MLRRLNRGEHVEAAADLARESAESRPLRDVPDDELDLGSVSGHIEAGRRGLWPARFQQSREDYEAQGAAYRAARYREIVGRADEGNPMGVAQPVRFACVTRRVPVRSRGRRQRRPGHRRTASPARAGPGGDSDSGEPDPPDAAGSLDDDWLRCAGLSAADVEGAADRIAAACGGFPTPLGLRSDVQAIWPDRRGDARSAALVAVCLRLPRPLREQHDRAVRAGTRGGAR